MTIYQKAQRVDLAILHALWAGSSSPDPVPFEQLFCRLCPGEEWVSRESVAAQLSALRSLGQVTCPPSEDAYLFQITTNGHSWLLAQTLSLTSQICTHPEPDSEPEEESDPAQALLCVDEDELNDWWDELDVEAKADAFVQWSLGNDSRNSHVYIEPELFEEQR